MHLIRQPVHVHPCSNSVVKGNNGTNRILYNNIAVQTITEARPRVSLLEPGIPDCKLLSVFFKRKLFLMDVGNSVKDDSCDHNTPAFPVICFSDIQVLWSWHQRVSIWAFLSVTRGLAIATHVGQVSWKQGVQDEYSVPLQFTCAAVVQWSFETILLNVRRSLSVNVDFRPRSLFADVFPRLAYAEITLVTVALETPSNVADLVTDAPAERTPRIRPLSKSDKFPIFPHFHTDWHSTQSVMHLYEHYRV
jgi:hypothetical protein